MKVLLVLLCILICFSAFFLCPPRQKSEVCPLLIKGVSFVAPPDPFQSDPMVPIKQLGIDWIALIPYAFSSGTRPELHYDVNHWQWWGETPEGIRESIRLARHNKLKVMLKPQVYIHRKWIGDLNFDSDSAWSLWENAYEKYILDIATMANESHVEMICIGTEIKHSAEGRPQFWSKLIQKLRKIYSGKLCYSANWDQYNSVPFWNELDYIGISAYFPLTDERTPSKELLLEKWKPWQSELEMFSRQMQKPILFTEYGYLSVDSCAGKSWELEPNVDRLQVNEQAQANAFDALYSAFWCKPYFAGGFLWKWFPEMKGHEGYPEKDYTPQGKLAESIIKHWNENHK